MNSNRLQYVPIEEKSSQSSKWLPVVVVTAAVAMGVVAGLGFSAASADNTSLYATPTVRATATYPVSAVQWTARPAVAGPSAEVEDVVEQDVLQQLTENQATSAPNTRWASFAILPIAAAAGFFFGSRKPASQSTVPETFEVVIDDGAEEVAMAATTGPKTDLYAVVAIGGHQYVVQPGQILSIDKLPLEIGDQFTFEKVLLLKNGEKVDFGRPYLSNTMVTAEVLRNSKGKKIRIFKYRAKKHTRLTKGHRQKYTDIHITEVAGQKVPSKVNVAQPVQV